MITFLGDLQTITSSLSGNKDEIEGVIQSNNDYFKKQESLIEDYFNHIN